MDASEGFPPPQNPFEQALQQTLFPTPPPAYKYRLGGQIGMCGLLMTVSLLYVILHYWHAHRTGMPSWLFKLKKSPKSAWGRPVMINSMLAFAILAFMGAGGQLGSRYYEWMVFIEGRKPLGYTAAQFTPWVPVFVQAWFFSITNLQATAAARAKLGSTFRGVSHPLLQNFILLGLPFIYVVMILPIALFCSAKQDRLFRDTWALEPILRQAAADYAAGVMPSMELIIELSHVQAKLQGEAHEFKQYVVVLCALCLGLSAVIGVMNTCNLFLVWALRASARSIRRHTLSVSDTTKAGTTQDRSAMGIDWDEYGAGSAFQDRDETGSATVCDSDLRSALPTFTFDAALKSKDHESLTAFAPSRQDLELKRLAADLTITIPCLLAMVTVMVVGLGVIINKQFDNITWPIQELTMDGFCWIYTIISTLAVCFLIVNLLKAWQIQQVVSPLRSTMHTDTSAFKTAAGASKSDKGKQILRNDSLERESSGSDTSSLAIT